MIKIDNISIYGWDAAIRGMRNPKNSWDKSDSHICYGGNNFTDCRISATACPRFKNSNLSIDGDWNGDYFCVGHNDLKLMETLANAGTDHGKFLRMITVTMDITAPLYWWKEYDTYKVGTVADSCSTMHKIQDKAFVIEDFSTEQLSPDGVDLLMKLIGHLNNSRMKFLETKNKEWWWEMIQLLPSSYNQRRTVQMNYAVLKNMYHARINHKLDEWKSFCKVLEQFPYAKELIIGKEISND